MPAMQVANSAIDPEEYAAGEYSASRHPVWNHDVVRDSSSVRLFVELGQGGLRDPVTRTSNGLQTSPVNDSDLSPIMADQGLALEVTCHHIDRGSTGAEDVRKELLG